MNGCAVCKRQDRERASAPKALFKSVFRYIEGTASRKQNVRLTGTRKLERAIEAERLLAAQVSRSAQKLFGERSAVSGLFAKESSGVFSGADFNFTPLLFVFAEISPIFFPKQKKGGKERAKRLSPPVIAAPTFVLVSFNL